jgi:hypothetical protein
MNGGADPVLPTYSGRGAGRSKRKSEDALQHTIFLDVSLFSDVVIFLKHYFKTSVK